MSNGTAMILAALIGSAPGWGAFGMAIYTQRRALPKQTRQLKAHIDAAVPAPAATRDTQPATGGSRAR